MAMIQRNTDSQDLLDKMAETSTKLHWDFERMEHKCDAIQQLFTKQCFTYICPWTHITYKYKNRFISTVNFLSFTTKHDSGDTCWRMRVSKSDAHYSPWSRTKDCTASSSCQRGFEPAFPAPRPTTSTHTQPAVETSGNFIRKLALKHGSPLCQGAQGEGRAQRKKREIQNSPVTT